MKDRHLFGIFKGLSVVKMVILLVLLFLVLLMLWYIEKLKFEKKEKKRNDTDYEIQSAVVNHKGRVRKNNEDNFYLNGIYMQREKMDDGACVSLNCCEEIQLYAVCDGMGGTDNGEDASYGAVKALAEQKKEYGTFDDPKIYTDVLRSISDTICKKAAQKGRKSGTTIVSVLIKKSILSFANVGDSRIYRLHNKKLKQISLDHSKVQRMIAMGLLTPEQAKTDPNRHVITQYLGMPTEIRVSPYYASTAQTAENDVYLLCSDGLTDMVEDTQIEAVLNQKANPKEAAQELIKAALENGGRDNVTVMVVKVAKRTAGKNGLQNKSYKTVILKMMQALTGMGFLAVVSDFIYYWIK